DVLDARPRLPPRGLLPRRPLLLGRRSGPRHSLRPDRRRSARRRRPGDGAKRPPAPSADARRAPLSATRRRSHGRAVGFVKAAGFPRSESRGSVVHEEPVSSLARALGDGADTVEEAAEPRLPVAFGPHAVEQLVLRRPLLLEVKA